jgi:hypothetical protein
MNRKELVEKAMSSKSDDYDDGYEICQCGGFNPLGKGFNKTVVIKCPLCKPALFPLHMNNPHILNGLGKPAKGPGMEGMAEAFVHPKQYYVSDKGLHLIREKLVQLE